MAFLNLIHINIKLLILDNIVSSSSKYLVLTSYLKLLEHRGDHASRHFELVILLHTWELQLTMQNRAKNQNLPHNPCRR